MRLLRALPGEAALPGAIGFSALALGWPETAWLSVPLAVVGLLLGRRARPLALGAAALPVILAAGCALDLAWTRGQGEAALAPRARSRVQALERRKDAVLAQLEAGCRRIAAFPGIARIGPGAPEARAALFGYLEGLRSGPDAGLGLGVHSSTGSLLAWSGSAAELGPSPPPLQVRRRGVATLWIAALPLPGGGFVTASLPVAVRRGIRNAFLEDFDLLAGGDPLVEVFHGESEDSGRSVELRGPGGMLLARAQMGLETVDLIVAERLRSYRRIAGVAVLVAALAWGLGGGPLRLAAAICAGRVGLGVLGWPPGTPASWIAPAGSAPPFLAFLGGSPLDLLATAAAVALLVGIAPRFAPPARAAAGCLAAVGGAGLLLAVLACAPPAGLDLEAPLLPPRSARHLLLQAALLVFTCATLELLRRLQRPARPLPTALAAAGLAAAAAVATQPWVGLPAVPWAALAAAPVVLARFGGARLLVRRVVLLMVATALVHVSMGTVQSERAAAQVERDYAPLVASQPEWRRQVLAAACLQLDRLGVLRGTAPGGVAPAAEELAFALWSATELASSGLSSAVEVQGPDGIVLSRFALNLPTLSAPDRPLPPHEGWETTREHQSLGSRDVALLHARRLLVYGSEIHGALHLYVGEDYWNLPFLQGRDPYSVLFRSGGLGPRDERSPGLVVYETTSREPLFSSLERPPAFDPAFSARRGAPGNWIRLSLEGQQHDAYAFRRGALSHLLTRGHPGPWRELAGAVEAMAAALLAAGGALVALLVVRTLLDRETLSLTELVRNVRQRFALRLFAGFTLAAVLPVAVLQLVVREFLVSRLRLEWEAQALDRVATARKAVEDFAVLQRQEALGAPVTDAAMVYVATLVDNDIDVFQRGVLLASSKRELYASGLLPPRLSGPVYRDLVLEGRPSVVRAETIGRFSHLVAATPILLDGAEPGVLALPLASRQREIEATLADLDRTIRLASVGFLLLSALLARELARRISGPISALTRATQAVAAGELEARVEATTDDEFRDLVASFNRMAAELVRQRAELERSNRLAAWADMARQVAHEVKNPLTPIQLSTEHLRRLWRDEAPNFGQALETCTDTILRQVRTLRGLVTEFSAFGRPPAPDPEVVDVAALARSVLAPYLVAGHPGVRLDVDLGPGEAPARLDRRLIERALVNLVENALQAVGERGRIEVRVRAEGARVLVEVEDDGPGLSAEARARLFQPFFSTKTSGSGLGLALVRKIAEDHHGGVSLEPTAGTGVLARLWLPAAGRGSGG